MTMTHDQLADIAHALANPIRLMILEKLADQSCCFHGDLSEELPIANSTLSQHLKVLKNAGLIQGEITPPKTKYCIHAENWEKAKQALSDFFNYNQKMLCCE